MPNSHASTPDYFAEGTTATDGGTAATDDRFDVASPSAMIPQSPVLPVFSYDRSCLFRIGQSQKNFWLHSVILADRSPHFKAFLVPIMRQYHETGQAVGEYDGDFSYPNFDELSFALFVSWCRGAKLDGPKDFHSLNHYVCLYLIAEAFQIEYLQNKVMNLIRWYYRKENMTAPAYRLETLYKSSSPNLLRNFMVITAAYRATGDVDGGISDSIRSVLRTYPDCALDFADALIRLGKNECADVRRGDDCLWHEHKYTIKCKPCPAPEPWETN